MNQLTCFRFYNQLYHCFFFFFCFVFFFCQAEDGIRDLVRSRGLGDVYKRQALDTSPLYNQKTCWADNVPPGYKTIRFA